MEPAQIYPHHAPFAASNSWPSYPHSYHGTPAHEYTDFTWSPGPVSCDPSFVVSRPAMTSFETDKTVPAYWPVPTVASLDAMASGHTSPVLRPDGTMLAVPHYIAGPMPHALATPPPRRTLTDEDRRNMCIYAEEHPSAKQTEIGARFKVDRSTVSKVLRNKDKYMSKDKAARSTIRKPQSKRQDIEKALTSWAMQQRRSGSTLTDEAIQFEGAKFASLFDSTENDPTRSPTWLGNFKQNIMNSHDRKDSAFDSMSSGSRTPHDLTTSPQLAAGLQMATTTHNNASRSVTPDSTHDSSPHMTPFLSATTATSITPSIVLPDDLYSSPLATLATRRAIKRAASPSSRQGSTRRKTEPSTPLPTLVDPTTAELLDYSFLLPTITDESSNSPLMEFPASAILRSNSTDGITIAPLATTLSPALPSPAMTTTPSSISVMHRRASDPALPPSLEDARSGLDTAWRYLQARKSLDGEECVVLGRMMERLKE